MPGVEHIACGCALALVGCSASAFACSSDAQCGGAGACEPEGWCSFPDYDCDGGRRFGDHAGDALGGTCVPVRGDSDSDGESGTTTLTAQASAATSSSADGDPTVANTTLAADEGTSSATTGDVLATDGSDTSTTGTPVDDDLLLWLTFDDPETPWADASDNGLTTGCEVGECPLSELGPSGPAMRFDGTDDHLVVADADALATPDALTVAVWINIDALATGLYQDVVTKAFGNDSLDSWAFGFPPAGSSLRFVVSDGAAQVVAGIVPWPPIGGWHHVTATWDGATVRTYLDGSLADQTDVAAVVLDDHPVLVGADIDTMIDKNFFAGAIDDVRVYRRALDDAEVAGLSVR